MFYLTFQQLLPIAPILFATLVDSPPSPAYSQISSSTPQLIVNSHLTDTPFLSQIPPDPTIPREPELPTPTLPTPQDEPLLPTPATPTTPETQPDFPGTITVEQFEFVGNTAFSDARLAEVTAPYTGKPITFAELLQAEAAVTTLYTEAGYLNSGAVIAADQALTTEDTVVTMQIIEGGLQEIQVSIDGRLNPGYVRSRLEVATRPPLNRNRLLRALQLLQLDPLIENLSAELSAGVRPQLSILEVSVTTADPFRSELFIDNGRSPSVGSFRRGVTINHANLLGFGDRLLLEYANTEGSNAYDLSYSLPVNPRNGTLTVTAGLRDTDVVEPPFDRLDIIGDSRFVELSFRQPFIQTPTRNFAIGLTASLQESETEVLGVGFPLSPGASDEGETRVSSIRFFQDITLRGLQDVFAARSQFSLGTGWFDATVNDEPPDSRFFAWRGQAQYVRLLAPETLLVLRSDMQLSTRALVPLEQFGVGGLGSVRGYRQDLLLTDNGIFASAEVLLPILRVPSVEGVLQIIPFVDYGIGWNSSGFDDPDPNSLWGVGLGLQWQMGDNFTARLDWGIPLTDVDSQDRTWQENGVYFSVNWSPF